MGRIKRYLYIIFVLTIISLLGGLIIPGCNIENKNEVLKKVEELVAIDNDKEKPTIKILNISNEKVIESNFIVGTANDNVNVEKVEIKIDDGEFIPCEGTTEWTYKLPLGTQTWTIKSKHTITVRSLDTAGNYSDELTITVYKGKNNDINGDGYSDFILFSGSNGYIFYGSKNGISSKTVYSADAVITNLNAYCYELGDINNDGYSDVCIGNPGGIEDYVYIYYGKKEGIGNIQSTSYDTILKSDVNNYFGAKIIARDVNKDGIDDLIISANYEESIQTNVYIFYGSKDGISEKWTTEADVTFNNENSTNEELGKCIGIGDINNDGYQDLVITADYYGTNSNGRIYIFYGNFNGFSGGNVSNADAIITGNDNDYFGYTLSIDDINNDSYDDIIVGNNNQQVFIFYGGAYPILSGNSSDADTIIIGNNQNGFGRSLVTGSINSDLFSDLIVSSIYFDENEETTKNYINIFYGSNTGIENKDLNSESPDAIINDNDNTYFGEGILATDLNGDGISDLIISANSGKKVYIFYGNNNKIENTSSQYSDSVITSEQYLYLYR